MADFAEGMCSPVQELTGAELMDQVEDEGSGSVVAIPHSGEAKAVVTLVIQVFALFGNWHSYGGREVVALQWVQAQRGPRV